MSTGPEDGRNGTNPEHHSGPAQWPANEGNRDSSDERSVPERVDIETDRTQTDGIHTDKEEQSDMPH